MQKSLYIKSWAQPNPSQVEFSLGQNSKQKLRSNLKSTCRLFWLIQNTHTSLSSSRVCPWLDVDLTNCRLALGPTQVGSKLSVGLNSIFNGVGRNFPLQPTLVFCTSDLDQTYVRPGSDLCQTWVRLKCDLAGTLWVCPESDLGLTCFWLEVMVVVSQTEVTLRSNPSLPQVKHISTTRCTLKLFWVTSTTAEREKFDLSPC